MGGLHGEEEKIRVIIAGGRRRSSGDGLFERNHHLHHLVRV
jgi:hypothetical protein